MTEQQREDPAPEQGSHNASTDRADRSQPGPASPDDPEDPDRTDGRDAPPPNPKRDRKGPWLGGG